MFLKVDWIVHRNTDHETFARLTLMMLDEITYWMMCHNDKTSWIRIPVCEVALIMTIWDRNSCMYKSVKITPCKELKKIKLELNNCSYVLV